MIIKKFINRKGVTRVRYCNITRLYHICNMTKPPLNEIFKYMDKKSKDKVMYEAHLQHGYSLKDKAKYTSVHYTTVSRAVRKIGREYER